MSLKPGSHIYFMGIGGTGMAAVAGLLKEAGFRISGSDKGVYPPMSDMLQTLAIPYTTPYSVKNLEQANPDIVVVANALSRGNEELEAMLAKGTSYTSFPAILGEEILAKKTSLVVTGTHGKTTTTTLISFILSFLGEEPGFMIGGLPRDFEYSFSLGKGPLFVIEGDEYDTAFFDKGPKFLHYKPQYAILNNLEFDHADIYKNLEEIEAQFTKFCALITNKKHLIANIDDPGIVTLLSKANLTAHVTKVSTLGKDEDADVVLLKSWCDEGDGPDSYWYADIRTKAFGTVSIKTRLTGEHNIANICQAVALLTLLDEEKKLRQPLDKQRLAAAFAAFNGVKRRLDRLGGKAGIDIYEDFAHHPTAIKLVIDGFRKMHPDKRLTVAFEPANATGRRNILQENFAKALSLADRVLIGKCPVDIRIPENERMDTKELAKQIGASKAFAFNENEELLNYLKGNLTTGDAVIFMSPSSFSGIQHLLAKQYGSK